jgi:hypothetical protein
MTESTSGLRCHAERSEASNLDSSSSIQNDSVEDNLCLHRPKSQILTITDNMTRESGSFRSYSPIQI